MSLFTSPSFPITIGKKSDNEIITTDLITLPHLFVSFSEHEQVHLLLQRITREIAILSVQSQVRWIAALSNVAMNYCKESIDTNKLLFSFHPNETENTEKNTKYRFWQNISKELKKRKKYLANNSKKFTEKHPITLVLIEDILGMAITRKKYTGLYFLQLLIEGPSVGMHCVAFSGRAYKNLLSQLLQLHPKMQAELQKQMPQIDFTAHYPLGAELIVTPEDFYFFKKRSDKDYSRYFNI